MLQELDPAAPPAAGEAGLSPLQPSLSCAPQQLGPPSNHAHQMGVLWGEVVALMLVVLLLSMVWAHGLVRCRRCCSAAAAGEEEVVLVNDSDEAAGDGEAAGVKDDDSFRHFAAGVVF